ncbi:hypothetical protein C8R43DRAFT_587530 [Mycena crocata]|nr:hypothetical protein C8R43DRAFT_587530 [Mycena crocata]
MEAQLLAMRNGSLTCTAGDSLFQKGQFEAAKTKYLEEARKIVGSTASLPSIAGQFDGGVVSSLYIGLNPVENASLMGCCLGMAKCVLREKDTEMALAWLEEINALFQCTYFTAKDPLYDWIQPALNVAKMMVMRAKAYCLASEIFASLGNTGTGTTRRHTAATVLKPLNDELTQIINSRILVDMYRTRHPNPQTTLSADMRSTTLQVRGSWKRLNIANQGQVTGRESFACFIWNSHFYLAGGRKSSFGPFYRDLWVIDLKTHNSWRQLPDYPIPFRQSGLFVGWNMVLHKKTAILFTGRPTVDVFNLSSERWTSFQTTYTPTAADIQAGVQDGWPYPNTILSDATMQIAHGKLYVFGGSHATTAVGCNLFMELDLTTRKWRRLSGYVRAPKHADYSCPGPRKSASSWVSTDRKRIFVTFGQADLEGGMLHGEAHLQGTSAFAYEDMWSWSIKDESWRRERMSGNPPCARTEVASAYNEKLKKTVIFGGYQPTLPTYVPEKNLEFAYSYFADTFVYDMTPAAPTTDSPSQEPTVSAPKWKQILTPGFPTYRCQAQLACDPDTGRTYLFGGWTNVQYVPTRTSLVSRSFGDLWELRMDEHGGHFNEVDVEEEARSARAGPWQRCFSCAAAGPWKKCGGSCKGRVFFCGGPCLKEGWKEHREMHQCRKT